MKILVQNFKTGELSVTESIAPKVLPNGILVRTSTSLISAGTDRAIVAMAKKSYLGKALDRPDLAKKVINKAKSDGLWATYKVVKNLISEPIPLGYSLVGEVVAKGHKVHNVAIGDRVACAGLGYANHAEIISVPQNLFARVPEGVDDAQAAYVTLGAIALHGVRQADQQLGSTVLVVGLGLVGQITAQLCNAAGLRVIGLDLDQRKIDLAAECGMLSGFTPDHPDLHDSISEFTSGYGVDAALLTAGSRENGKLFETVAGLCRDRARVVVVGDVKMDISRRSYFEKELEIVQSRSYGPGRYDPNYEEKGQDYPIGYVRWTEQRNMQSFLQMIAESRLNIEKLTTHTYDFEQAESAYQQITTKNDDLTIGVLLKYTNEGVSTSEPELRIRRSISNENKIKLGVIGCGQFAKGVLLPAFRDSKQFHFRGVASARGISANSVKQNYSADYATEDPQQILTDQDIDAVIITTRHDSHGYYVKQALENDKHVFVEKPLCISNSELIEIKAALAKSKGSLMVGYNRRFSPILDEVTEYFRDRTEPLTMLYRVNAGRVPLNSEGAWIHDGFGGRIIGEVCHFVDTMQKVIDSKPVEITCHGLPMQRSDLAANDNITLTIVFADGSIGTVHYWANGDKVYPKEHFEIFGQEKIAIVDNYRKLKLIRDNRQKQKRYLKLEKGFSEEVSAFIHQCRTGEQAISLDSLISTSEVTLSAVEFLNRERITNNVVYTDNIEHAETID